MSAIETSAARSRPPRPIGWALLQFVWQGAVVGVLTALALLALCAAAPPTSATSSPRSAWR